MKKTLLIALCIAVSTPVMAKGGSDKPQTYSQARAGKSLQNQQASNALNKNNYDANCVYCWRDTSIEFNPSARKYSKTVQ